MVDLELRHFHGFGRSHCDRQSFATQRISAFSVLASKLCQKMERADI
jgi:hypothetical protein